MTRYGSKLVMNSLVSSALTSAALGTCIGDGTVREDAGMHLNLKSPC